MGVCELSEKVEKRGSFANTTSKPKFAQILISGSRRDQLFPHEIRHTTACLREKTDPAADNNIAHVGQYLPV
jgi:hypothetical protein